MHLLHTVSYCYFKMLKLSNNWCSTDVGVQGRSTTIVPTHVSSERYSIYIHLFLSGTLGMQICLTLTCVAG